MQGDCWSAFHIRLNRQSVKVPALSANLAGTNKKRTSAKFALPQFSIFVSLLVSLLVLPLTFHVELDICS